MASRITEFVINAVDPDALAAWWCTVLGYEVLERDEEGWVEIGQPGQAVLVADDPDADEADRAAPSAPWQPTLLFAPVAEPPLGRPRLHFDINPTDRDQTAELDWLLNLGAVRTEVGQAGDESWEVLADPEGNVFCLLASRVRALRRD
ncbi:VOC family protein [Arthrobacter sp. KK5.5]|uniref:VOC family protein n=1 Tax=Arthrobacter sp. KK5.5 TaxID=3373084 RepID=UPI003EE7E2E6